MKIKTYLPVFTGFYGTLFESDETSELDDINEKREKQELSPITWDDCKWDYKEYNERVAKAAVNWVENALKDIFKTKITIEFEELISPREYSFANDSINVVISYKVGEFLPELKKYLNDNWEEFSHYIKDRYTSCSGFSSFYSNNANTWVSEYLPQVKDRAHILGSILNFVLLNEEQNEEAMHYGICGEMYINALNYDELCSNEVEQ